MVKYIHLCPGVTWFSAGGAHEEVKTFVSESYVNTAREIWHLKKKLNDCVVI